MSIRYDMMNLPEPLKLSELEECQLKLARAMELLESARQVAEQRRFEIILLRSRLDRYES